MSQEPLFWYRPRSDGGYEGPLHNGQIEDVRKASGAWVPLFAGAAPVSAEPVAWMTHHDEPMLFPTDEEARSYCDDDEQPIPLYAAPVAAQPDVTQQTLDDVMAGIPARDAEIEALRKKIDTLRAQQDADKVDAEPDMFWNADNPEQCQSSIHNLLVEIQCDRSLHVGNIVEVQRAMRLPNISVRITTVDDDGDLEFKIINEAAIDAARMESSQ